MELRIDRLSKTYANGTRALHDVSLVIPPGMFGLLGPNGAGKSTLMRILSTLQEADGGTAHLTLPGGGAGPNTGPNTGQNTGRNTGTEIDTRIDVLRDKRAVRRTLGYLPQEFGLYPNVVAEELLDHFAVLEGITDRTERGRIVDALFAQTNLAGQRGKKLGSYSGGMRQRFGIAVALLGDPRLIIVDEPTAGLDPAERVRFLNLLAELGENAIVILSTHIVDDVSELCSRMAIIDRGEIRLQGEPAAAVADVRGRIWVRAIERAALPEYQRSHAVISTKLAGGRTLVRVFADSDPGEGFAPADATLEDVYFAALRPAAASTGA